MILSYAQHPDGKPKEDDTKKFGVYCHIYEKNLTGWLRKVLGYSFKTNSCYIIPSGRMGFNEGASSS